MAQGNFSCYYWNNPSSYSIKVGECRLSQNNCSEGYVPEFNCSLYNHNKEKCEGTFKCVKKENQDIRCISKTSSLQCTDPKYPVSCVKDLCCKAEEDCGTEYENIGEIFCPGNNEIKTALGCIPINNLNEFVGWLLKNLIFIASGIAFILMVFGAIQILTSSGNPDKVKAGGELITSAVSGLLLIILSLFLLRLIGVDILHIPGFGN